MAQRPFHTLLREVLREVAPEKAYKITAEAVLLVQTAVEAAATQVFADGHFAGAACEKADGAHGGFGDSAPAPRCCG